MVEYATSNKRTIDGMRSWCRYYRQRMAYLNSLIEGARRELENGTADDPVQMRKCLQESIEERDCLDKTWVHNSLKDYYEEHVLPPVPGSESRSMTTGSPVTFRAAGTASTRTAKSLRGIAAPFNSYSVDLGGFREIIRPGAFRTALRTSDAVLLYNHESDHGVLARESAKTLELTETKAGLAFTASLLAFDGQSYSIARHVERLDLAKMSFAFYVASNGDEWQLPQKRGDLMTRVILPDGIALLVDVSVVAWPAYPGSSVTATFQEVTRAAVPAVNNYVDYVDDDADVPPRPAPARRERTISSARQRALARRLEAIEADLHRWDVDHVEQIVADLERRRDIEMKRQAHLRLHPGDKGRLDIPGGLLVGVRR